MNNYNKLFITLFILFWTSLSIAVPRIIPSPPSVNAKAYILMDHDSGKVITAGNRDERLAPASLTKIMTSYAVFHELRQGNIAMNDMVTISEKAWRTGGSKMFIEVGDKISVQDLLNGMVISSGNDASVALAEHIGGAEETFAQLMNQYAEILRMKNSNFMNSTGMPAENHYTSAADMAILSQALIREFPEYYPIYAEKEFTFGKELNSGKPIKQLNRNKLLWRDESVDGLKTGHTEAAGYCLVASAAREDMRLISVVLGTSGTEARAQETQKLLNFGFRFYETRTVATADQSLASPTVWKGDKDKVNAGVEKPVTITIGRNQFKDLQTNVLLDQETFEAPIPQGTPLGTLVYSLDGKPVVKVPLIALEEVPQGGLVKQLKDSVKMWVDF